jgi:hypothetical protein
MKNQACDTSDAAPAARAEFGPWNPGIESQLPRQLLPLATLFRPENVFTSVERAEELRDLTGLRIEELVAFRSSRLVLHELLIRVTADLSVPDGPRVEDLGIAFRRMVTAVLARDIEPHHAEIENAYGMLRRQLAELIDSELAASMSTDAARRSPAGERRRFLARLRGGRARARPGGPPGADRIAHWERRAHEEASPLRAAALRAIARVTSAVYARHGRFWGEPRLLASVATDLACNDHGSEAIGRMIEPWIAEAVAREGYARLPAQPCPVVMNTKGASASGKSTMRPLQKQLAERIGVRWSDFAFVSPDIWRKRLLDYGSLGESYKYAGAFTGQELRVIDEKLDRYMALKAERGGIPHLLIDRFRFDSFAPESDEAGSNLLTRFGHAVYLFFMITPPHATVERSWQRGLDVGRYKAVDDVLAHNVEAYAGMPDLFFTWALGRGKSVYYEFLDNSVARGERPRTAAFGWDGELNVLDVKCMLDVDRYRKIDVDARSPEEVYRDRAAMAAGRNTRFLGQCARRLPALNFVDPDAGLIYARIESGALAWIDRAALERALVDPDTRAGVSAVAPDALGGAARTTDRPRRLSETVPAERLHTLGQWGAHERAPR